MKIVWHWIILSVGVWAISYFINGIDISPIWIALIVGAIFTLINLIIHPIIKILTLPINLITFGLFSLVLNGVIFYFVSVFITGFSVDSFLYAVIGALLISLLSWIINRFN